MLPNERETNRMTHEQVAEHVLRLRKATDQDSQTLLTELLTEVYPTREVQDA